MRIALEVASGLLYLQTPQRGFTNTADKPTIIHRDIKGSNILLDSEMRARIGDTGLARETQNNQSNTSPVGTQGYCDPDYFNNYTLSTACDVFSLGVVFCQLLTSKQAITVGPGPPQVLHQFCRVNIPQLTTAIRDEQARFTPEVCKEFGKLCKSMIALTPVERPSMNDVVTKLESLSAPPSAPPLVLDRSCIVCLDADREVRTRPCFHWVMCKTCADLIMQGNQKCPFCNTRMDSLETGNFETTFSPRERWLP